MSDNNPHQSTLRGHPIRLTDDGEWVYCDTGEPTVEGWEERSCGHCGLSRTVEGHDGCIGTLPGVKNACCGHGEVELAYVQLDGGVRLAGKEAIKFFEGVKDIQNLTF